MSRLENHPTVRQFQSREPAPPTAVAVDPIWLRECCLKAGADDVGFVEIGRAALATERDEILTPYPSTKTLISFVCRMNREPVRSPHRSTANVEFHHTADEVNEVAHRIVRTLEDIGYRAMNPPAAFPMEAAKWPNRM